MRSLRIRQARTLALLRCVPVLRRVRRPSRSLLVAAGLGLLAGCGSARLAGFAEPVGGHDATGPGDQLYFHLAHAADHPGRLAALILPEDWPERPAVQGPDGDWRLAAPVEPVWRHGDEIEPPASLNWRSGEGEEFVMLTVSPEVTPVPRWSFDGLKAPEERDAAAMRLLDRGRNAYLIEALDDSAYPPLRVSGAVALPGGGLRWIELAVLRFEDGRPWPERTLHRTVAAADDVLKFTLFAGAAAAGLWLTGWLLTEGL